MNKLFGQSLLQLVVFQKKIIKFFEVALVSIHYNCLIDWIVMAQGYRPWNTINTTMDICLLVENGNKKNETKRLSSHFAALRPTLGHWQGGSITHSMLITTLFQVQPKVHREPCKNVGSHSMTEHISGIRVGILPILNVTCYPTMSLPKNCTRNNWPCSC